jgi:sialic acid synthase SpsE
MESMQEEIDAARKTAADTVEQLTKARNQLSEKDEDYKSLQADAKRQLIEVYEMK